MMAQPIWKTATNSAPKKCKCGGTFTKPQVHKPTPRAMDAPFSRGSDMTRRAQERGAYYVKCRKCGIFAVWSFPNIWRIRSPLALFDSHEVIG